MRILLQNSTFYPHAADEAGATVLLLARALSARGHHVDVVATTGRRRGKARALAERRVDGVSGTIFEAPAHGFVDLVDVAGGHPSFARRTLHRWASARSPRWGALVERLLETTSPDVLHTHTLAGMTVSVWKSAARRGLPVLHSLHDRHLLEVRSGRATRQVQVVLAPSRFVLDQHRARGLFAHARAELLRAPAHPLVEPRPTRDTPRVPRALHLGPLTVERGIPLLLELLQAWFEDADTPPLNFSFAGTGPLEDRVRRFCSSWSKRASFHGPVEGAVKDQLLRESDVMVIACRGAEPVESVVLDAFRHALPVIATACGSLPEWIDADVTGTLVASDPADLRAALLAHVREPALRHARGEAGHAKAAQLGLDAYVNRLLELYANVGAEALR